MPPTGVAKCRVMAAFEPPAAIPQRARKEALRQRIPTRRPGMERKLSRGESVSRMTAASLRMSARRR